MISVASKPWVIVAATLFVVALLLLALILRDQRKAIKALDDAAATVTTAVAMATVTTQTTATAETTATDADAEAPAQEEKPEPAAPSPSAALHLAGVERGRIAMMGGLVALIWLVILILMVWH